MNSNWPIIQESEKIQEALSKLNELKGTCLYVVDSNGRVKGSITDGDIRRGFLSGASVETSVTEVMQKNFSYLTEGTSCFERDKFLKKNNFRSLPVLNENKELKEIYKVGERKKNKGKVFLLAGGLGTRLGSLTKDTPKPMIEVGGKPILERIINSFVSQGLVDIYISLNYKAEAIESYFKDGSDFNCNITYVKESKRLGTAGPLSLIPPLNDEPLIVMNGDLVTKINFNQLIDFHLSKEAVLTMGARNYEIQIPYGVINAEDNEVQTIVEKPRYTHIVNTGVYVLDQEAIDMVPQNEFFDMPTLINNLLGKKDTKICCFPVHGDWIDIGERNDLESARNLFDERGNE